MEGKPAATRIAAICFPAAPNPPPTPPPQPRKPPRPPAPAPPPGAAPCRSDLTVLPQFVSVSYLPGDLWNLNRMYSLETQRSCPAGPVFSYTDDESGATVYLAPVEQQADAQGGRRGALVYYLTTAEGLCTESGAPPAAAPSSLRKPAGALRATRVKSSVLSQPG